jgi:hypothetical protein
MGIAVLQPMGDGRAEDVAALAPVVTHPPTGDSAVDEALRQFDAVTDQPLDTQIEVGEQVHRVLLSRLADLGKE